MQEKKAPKPKICFTLEEEQKDEVEYYARAKGLHNGATLARFAVFQYMKRFPLASRKAVQRKGTGKEKEEGRNG